MFAPHFQAPINVVNKTLKSSLNKNTVGSTQYLALITFSLMARGLMTQPNNNQLDDTRKDSKT